MCQKTLIFEMKDKPIRDRISDFEKSVWLAAGQCFDKYSKELLREFTDYWIEYNPEAKKPKMRWEKERDKPRGVWNLSMRLARWARNSKPAKTNQVTHPNWFDKKYASGLSSEEYQDYKKHLINKGFSFGGGASGGSFVRKPNGEMIWL